MQLQMVGHLGDPIGEQRNLDLRRARIGLVAAKFTLQLLLAFFGKWHFNSRVPQRPSLLAARPSRSGALCAPVQRLCAGLPTPHLTRPDFAKADTNSLYFRGRYGDRLTV
jgi:hypothetical protein